MISAETYQSFLSTSELGRKYYFIEEVDSTNIYAVNESVEPMGLVCAEKQTKGRGRSGRVWQSDNTDSLYFTVVLGVDTPAELLPLNIVLGYAVVDAVRRHMNCALKWPNDIISSGRKMGGILMEAGICGGKVEKLIAGVGLNINNDCFPDEISSMATSMFNESGSKFIKEQILAEIMNSLEIKYSQFKKGELDIRKMWKSYSANLDKKINVHKDGVKTPFTERGITEMGTLLAEDALGLRTEIVTGDIGYDICR